MKLSPDRKYWLFAAGLVVSLGCNALSTDRSQPTRINSDNGGQVDRKTGVTVFQGNVELVKGSLKIDADTLTLKDAGDKVTYVAVGSPATMKQQPEEGAELVEATSDRIEYLENEGKILLIGNASIKQGGATTRADRLEYDIAKENLIMEGRIEFVIPPRQQQPESGAPGSGDSQ